jgi:hypothetical protein
MKRFLILIFSFISAFNGMAQSMETVKKDTVSKPSIKSKIDSGTEKVNDKIDGFQTKVNSFSHPDLKTILSKKTVATDTVQSDSLKEDNHKRDSLKQNLAHKIDSIKGLNFSPEKFTHLTDSLKQAGPYKSISEAESKITAFEKKINQPADKVEGAINEKLSLMNKEGGNWQSS